MMPSKVKKNCPECGAQVRLDNLEEHYRKVHPKADRSGILTEEEKTDLVKEKRSPKRKTRTNKRYILTFAALAMIVIFILVLILYFPFGSRSGEPAPNFSLKDTDGNTVRLADYRGQVVLLSMIDPKGGPCQSETKNNILPLFNSYGSRVVFMTIDVQLLGSDTTATLKDFKTQIGATWKFLLDDGSAKSGYGIVSTPRAYIVDRSGNIFYQHTGMSQASELSAQLDKALK